MSAAFWNGIIAEHAAAVSKLAKAVTPKPHNQWVYRGWNISASYPPIPCRDFDWSATHPDYDASYEGEEDGWVSCGGQVNAATYEELLAEIDTWEAIAEEDAREEAAAHGPFGVGA